MNRRIFIALAIPAVVVTASAALVGRRTRLFGSWCASRWQSGAVRDSIDELQRDYLAYANLAPAAAKALPLPAVDDYVARELEAVLDDPKNVKHAFERLRQEQFRGDKFAYLDGWPFAHIEIALIQTLRPGSA